MTERTKKTHSSISTRMLKGQNKKRKNHKDLKTLIKSIFKIK